MIQLTSPAQCCIILIKHDRKQGLETEADIEGGPEVCALQTGGSLQYHQSRYRRARWTGSGSTSRRRIQTGPPEATSLTPVFWRITRPASTCGCEESYSGDKRDAGGSGVSFHVSVRFGGGFFWKHVLFCQGCCFARSKAWSQSDFSRKTRNTTELRDQVRG